MFKRNKNTEKKYPLRLSTELYSDLENEAEKNSQSVNSYINEILSDETIRRRYLNSVNNPRIAISKRLHGTLELLKRERYNEMTPIKVAELLNIDGYEKVYNFFSGVEEPSKLFIDQYCDFFGISRDYIVEGKYSPFSSCDNVMSELMPFDYYDQIVKYEPEQIWFVRDEEGYSCFFLQINKYKYIIFDRVYHLNSHIGGTGANQIVSFYKLIIKVLLKHGITKVSALNLDKDEFNKLINGKLYPQHLIKSGCNAAWHQDIIDIYREDSNRDQYLRLFGESMKDAMDTIKRHFLKPDENPWEEFRKLVMKGGFSYARSSLWDNFVDQIDGYYLHKCKTESRPVIPHGFPFLGHDYFGDDLSPEGSEIMNKFRKFLVYESIIDHSSFVSQEELFVESIIKILNIFFNRDTEFDNILNRKYNLISTTSSQTDYNSKDKINLLKRLLNNSNLMTEKKVSMEIVFDIVFHQRIHKLLHFLKEYSTHYKIDKFDIKFWNPINNLDKLLSVDNFEEKLADIFYKLHDSKLFKSGLKYS